MPECCSFGNSLLEAQSIIEPSKRAMLEERIRDEADEAEPGEPPEPEELRESPRRD